ncbi:hypothetical protein CGMCC3_g5378 [Colletotrichum fructicola]|uniref:Isopropanol dehydrogenase n=1 Tax=Colletotrichum fructicola (strain Nara gc5) TaxID=1213859 RepID=L2G6H3_COLFN|nr:uncharacterized protein CGMCC3_g5378 [Colletotrichum fructicola]KAE9578611.1 hypothetical protein CGMCC3_g5378 [Colletotrichum fructicola]KAF4426290.1 NAD-dependent alcohol dehydrogenase [Colletotrichum fructicola]KAF4481097.1 NAD-dependent alcohol dehydrogenase [Colletotrichum fructicola Nara gc5]
MVSPTPTNFAMRLTAFGAPLTKVELPVPEASAGTVVVRNLATSLTSYMHLILDGKLPQHNLQLPVIPNPPCVGRIHAVGPDAVRLKSGDLVYIQPMVQARDDPYTKIVQGHICGTSDGAYRLWEEWKEGAFQQYTKVPLENCILLNEDRLCGELGYRPAVLQSIANYAVSAGAIIEAAKLKPAETIIIGPSSGMFSGLAVEIALAVGGNVIALGRSESKLAAMKQKIGGDPGRLKYVVMTGDDETDYRAIMQATPDGAGAEVYNDWTPEGNTGAFYLSAASRTLKFNGRIVLSGGTTAGLGGLSYISAVTRDLQILGKWVCNRQTVEQLLGMVTCGLLRIGVDSGTIVKEFTLDQVMEAVEYARENVAWRHYAVVCP